ncbi:MAG: PilN domain-containing protein [Acidobacteriaceae bacterium]|nr:PilN domain-containing protein [Acidobacteriaceae bacterium]
MKIQINLATRPYIEWGPIFLRLRLVMAALGVLVVGLGIWAHVLSLRVQRATAQIDQVHAATVKVQQEKLSSEARMKQPVNAEVLDRAHFLNAVFLRKSFSWTAVMMDLETVLPTGVQVTAIEPQITQEGDVIIRLRVSGDRDRAVQLVRNLERSKRFLHPRLSGEATQAKQAGQQNAQPQLGPAGVEFDILANYNPLPPNETYKFDKPDTEPAPASAVPVAAPVPMRTPGVQRPVVLAPRVPTPAPRPAAPVRPLPQQPQPSGNPMQQRGMPPNGQARPFGSRPPSPPPQGGPGMSSPPPQGDQSQEGGPEQ